MFSGVCKGSWAVLELLLASSIHPVTFVCVNDLTHSVLHLLTNGRLFNQGHFKELVLVAKQGIIGWAQSNTQTILEVAESLWHIIRTNLSMIMGVTGEILSLVLSGGQACIEFILDMVSDHKYDI